MQMSSLCIPQEQRGCPGGTVTLCRQHLTEELFKSQEVETEQSPGSVPFRGAPLTFGSFSRCLAVLWSRSPACAFHYSVAVPNYHLAVGCSAALLLEVPESFL